VLSRICNCDILPPINQDHLIARGADFDVAILSIYPSNLNYQYCLPNKLYQFIQSRLPIVCGPTPAIAAIVHDYQIGVVAEDFTAAALASALQSLTSRRLEHMRINLERAARELSWDRDQQILIEAVHSVVNAGT
jgi:glycosyltransferase involved in cell wall biosynthesis